MKLYQTFLTLILISLFTNGTSQSVIADAELSKIRNEGFQHSEAKSMLLEFTDVYGQRLTGSREYLAAAKWAAAKMKAIGLDNVHFENFCKDCRGWSMKSFNVEFKN